MLNDITIYSVRKSPITLYEVQELMKSVLPNVEFVGNPDATKRAMTKWFIALPAKPIGINDTMQDSQMLLVDVTNDNQLALSSAKMLLLDLQQAESDSDSQMIVNVLRNARQSFFSTIDFEKDDSMTKLQLVLNAALLKLGDGLFHEAVNDEFIRLDAYKPFVKKYAGANFDEICNLIKKIL